MRSFISIITSVLIVLILSGCSDFFLTEVDTKDLPDSRPMLVVKSIISPENSEIMAVVGKTTPYFSDYSENSPGTTSELIENATVFIKHKNTSYQLLFNKAKNAYVLPNTQNTLKVIQGEMYEIEVSATGYESVSASTIVPLSCPQSATLTSIDTVKTGRIYSEEVHYTFQFKDTPNERNYYSGVLECKVLYKNGNRGLLMIPSSKQHISDRDVDGETLEFSFKIGKYNYSEYSNLDTVARLLIYSYDEPLWLYNSGIEKSIETDSENPFMEPIIVYSNIKNGRGIFGSLRQLSVPVKLKK